MGKLGNFLKDAGRSLVNVVTSPVTTLIGKGPAISADKFENEKWGKAVNTISKVTGVGGIVAGGVALGGALGVGKLLSTSLKAVPAVVKNALKPEGMVGSLASKVLTSGLAPTVTPTPPTEVATMVSGFLPTSSMMPNPDALQTLSSLSINVPTKADGGGFTVTNEQPMSQGLMVGLIAGGILIFALIIGFFTRKRRR